MGEGRGVAGRVGARRQAESWGCVKSAERLARHADRRFRFGTGTGVFIEVIKFCLKLKIAQEHRNPARLAG